MKTFIKSVVFLFIIPLLLNAQVSVVGELSQDLVVKPGGEYSGSIIIRNDTNEPQEAKVYQTDYTFQWNGTNNYGEPGKLPRSNAKWITFSPAFITLPPMGTITLHYTLNVPKESQNATLAGTYWSMLMVEGIAKGSAESSAPQNGQMGIRQTIRYGIQIASTIAKTGTKKIQFLAANIVQKEDGKRLLQIDIENTGDIGIRPDVYVELFNDQGVSLGKFSGVKNRIYPGTSVRESIDVSSVEKGTYKALVVVDTGGDDVFGSQYTLKF
jgi:hypothetical protein